jgi:hypothetical protein
MLSAPFVEIRTLLTREATRARKQCETHEEFVTIVRTNKGKVRMQPEEQAQDAHLPPSAPDEYHATREW